VVAGGVALATLHLLERRPPGGRDRWVRSNFRGESVDLLAGPAAALGAASATLPLAVAGRPGPLLLTTLTGSLGLYDDLAGETHARGLRGHLQALREGRVTTGLVKMAGLFAAAAATVALDRHATAPGDRNHATLGSVTGVVADAALVSGTANLVNLLDLCPGRALKVVVLTAVPLAAGRHSTGSSVTAAGLLGTAAALLPDDLGERRMVGDCGANSLGALAGWALTDRLDRRGRTAALAGVVALTLLSERVSFSAAIDRTPALRAVDAWGRRPA
jgi:UDP-N-acetylmuramyl pentapeptide phosphotransferase/UDP-N-acetylglucosamine-1-phosphate transferase